MVTGHRDTNLTACPEADLYVALPKISAGPRGASTCSTDLLMANLVTMFAGPIKHPTHLGDIDPPPWQFVEIGRTLGRVPPWPGAANDESQPYPRLHADALAGRHRNPRKGACFMEMASFLAGERWSDHPQCTHPPRRDGARDQRPGR